MGVRQFNKAFGHCAMPIKDICKIIKGKRVIIDVSISTCAAIKAMYQGSHLTDKNGVPTAGINTILNNIIKYEKCGAKVLGVFDNPKPNPLKSAEYKKRKCIRAAASEKADNAETDEDKRRHEAAAWSLTTAVVQDAQTLLRLLGITFYVSPVGREAEQYAADLVKNDEADIIITNDTDAIMFGAPIVIMMNQDKKTKNLAPWVMFELKNILEICKIDMPTFQKMCIALGTDFSPKTSNVGPKTVFTSGKNKPLSQEQEIALAYIQSECNEPAEYICNSNMDKDGLIKWLVELKGFNFERLQKKLKHI